MMKSAGLGHHALRDKYEILGLPLVETHANYHSPATYDDELMVHSHVEKIGRSSLRVEHRIYKEGQLVVEGHEIRVWAKKDPQNPSKIITSPIPPEIRKIFSGS